jgi:hypothetical protein
MSQHKRHDRTKARRERALVALRDNRFTIVNMIATIEDDLAAFARNERSLDRATVSVERELFELKRDLDRIDMEIAALEKPPEMSTRSTNYTLTNYLDDMESH